MKSNSLMQIPHFTEETVAHCVTGSKGAVKGLREYLQQPASERRGLADMSPEQIKDVNAFIEFIGTTKVTAKPFVNDETEFAQGDIATITVTIERSHLKDGEAAGPVHAPYFPIPKYEEWWVFLLENDGRCIHFERIRSQEKLASTDIKFRLGAPGAKKFWISAISDSYVGLDHRVEVNIDVLRIQEVMKEVFVHPDDALLDQHPTLFDQILGAQKAEESDDSDDDDGEDAPSLEPAVEDSDSEEVMSD